MKLECSKEQLKKIVGLAEKITSKNHTLPILETVLLTADDSSFFVKATNLEVGVEFNIPAKVHKNGNAAVSGPLLNNILNSLQTKKDIIIESKNNNTTINTNKNFLLLKNHPNKDFPIIPTLNKENNKKRFSIKTNKLISGIQSVIYSASNSDIKPEIASIYIYPEGKNLVFVATDSIRLAEKKVSTNTYNDFEGIILPWRAAQELIRIFTEHEPQDIDIVFDENQVTVSTKRIYFTSRIINSTFPDYHQIIPKKHTTEAVLLKQDLINAFKTTNIFSDKFNRADIFLSPKDKQLEIKARNDAVGESVVHIDAATEGEKVDTSFNQKYLTDCLPYIQQDSLSLQFNGQNKPLLIKGVGDNTFTYVVMPLNK